jgi:protein ImuB
MRPHLFVGRAETPVAFVETVSGGIRLKALDREAMRAGLQPGLTLADARSRVPELEVYEHDAHADHEWLERLADGCQRYTPSVALDEPDGLILDIAGCVHEFEGERRLAADLEERLARRGVLVRHAFGDTPDTARALARFAGAPAPDEKRAVKRLPVAALGLDEDATIALSRAGLKTVGDVMARPLATIAARFGEEAAMMIRRLDGSVKGPIIARRSVAKIGVERRFAEPIARTEYALEMLAELATEAAGQLSERHEGGRRWEARLFRADGLVQRLRIETGQPTRDVALAEKLDASQLKLEGGEAQKGEVAQLVDQLGTRLGRARVRRFSARDSHIPEQAELMLPAAEAPAPTPWIAPETGEPPLRPIYLFDPPQPIESMMAEVPDGPPHRFRWRRTVHDVAHSEGPERIAGEWWRRQDIPTRDYYRIEDRRGRRFWIFRHGLYSEMEAPRWYLHGVFA